ncbi:uncharacterized protein LOC115070005 [Nannospalax galili]|uniref:uncharacterized protein LOC115070005 n=1 Tax=Nannospalax galili TaxID=1026970 RepID=UPI00111C9083|nr:uncharacterized protein LOC115070005 [Nannospalax galili]XP_029418331.1 uncharacterized protein LOC115070005 [Nannospalax galili]XP_029418332.1 uncharacterized protein LOC115070005 [Nannospalax galili]
MISLITIEVFLISCPVATANDAYWAFLPEPPMFHIATWERASVKVTTNDTLLMGGESNAYLTIKERVNVTFEGHTDGSPMCFYTDSSSPLTGCFLLSLRTVVADSPSPAGKSIRSNVPLGAYPERPPAGDGNRDLWTLKYTYLDIPQNKYNVSQNPLPALISRCEQAKLMDSSWDHINDHHGFPNWFPCGFPSKTVHFSPFNYSLSLADWSVSRPDYNYKTYLSSYTNKFIHNSHSLPTEPLSACYSPGWVIPQVVPLSISGRQHIQRDLYKLLAAIGMITLHRPHGNPKITSKPLQACVGAPFAILQEGPHGFMFISHNSDGSFYGYCSYCILSNCLTRSKTTEAFIILRHPSYVMLPVTLSEPWYIDPSVHLFQDATTALQ